MNPRDEQKCHVWVEQTSCTVAVLEQKAFGTLEHLIERIDQGIGWAQYAGLGCGNLLFISGSVRWTLTIICPNGRRERTSDAGDNAVVGTDCPEHFAANDCVIRQQR